MTPSHHLQTARLAAAAAAKITTKYFADLGSAAIQNKTKDEQYEGIVTRADVEAEKTIVDTIRAEFPDHDFLAEEEHSTQEIGEHLWIIDPIDGTNNFAHGIPHYAISVAYYHNGSAQCGCILSPESGDEFLVEQGRGAWHNGQQVFTNKHATIADTMIAVGFYYDRGKMMRATLDAIEDLFRLQTHGIRRMGTAALDIVQVGLGRFGAYFEYQLSPWDFAAARLFLEEAGGTITTCTGGDLKLEKSSVLATNTFLHEPMLDVVRKHANY